MKQNYYKKQNKLGKNISLDRFENMQGKQVKGIPLQMNLQNCCYKEPVLI